MDSSKKNSRGSTINFRLAQLIKKMPEDQQFLLLKQMLKDNITATLFELVGKSTDAQQELLLEQLEQNLTQPVSLEETELAIREHSRKTCMINASYEVEGQVYHSFMLDISPAGAFIETNDKFAPGQEIKLTFSVPKSGKIIDITGEILWKGMLGIGVKFGGLYDDQIESITSFLEEEERF